MIFMIAGQLGAHIHPENVGNGLHEKITKKIKKSRAMGESSMKHSEIIKEIFGFLGKKLILSREKAFTSLMLIFGHIKLLQVISEKLNFSENFEVQKLKDKFFH